VLRVALALVCLLGAGCTVSGSRSATDNQEVVARAVELGIAYLRQGDTLRAKENIHKALDVDPKSPEAHASLALVFQQEQEWTLAESHFNKAIALDPKNSAARNNFGAFLYAKGRAEEAIAQLQVAVSDQFYARRGQAFENLGFAHKSLADIDEAKVAFDRALSLNPKLGRSMTELALLHFDEQAFEQARVLDARLDQFGSMSSRRLLLCGLVAHHFSDEARAQDCYAAMKKRYPRTGDAKRLGDLVEERT
jgi:type IV pilus assembly protein PilF